MNPQKRIAVKVTTDCNNYWMTEINTDLQGAKDYYLGKYWDMGGPEGPEKFEKVTMVEQLYSVREIA